MERKEYLEYRSSAAQNAKEEIGKYDFQVLLLSSGAITISLTFYDKIAGTEDPEYTFFLIFSWILFGASLISVLASHYFAFKSYHFDIKQIDTAYDEGESYSWKSNPWSKTTEIANLLSFGLFVAGAISLMCFAYSNLGD